MSSKALILFMHIHKMHVYETGKFRKTRHTYEIDTIFFLLFKKNSVHFSQYCVSICNTAQYSKQKKWIFAVISVVTKKSIGQCVDSAYPPSGYIQ